MKSTVSSIARQERIVGYLFIAPFLAGFLLFQGLPFLAALLASATNLRFASNFSRLRWVGLRNFLELASDGEFQASLLRTLLYSGLYVPSIMACGLAAAFLLDKKVFARDAVRTMIFLPYVSNIVAISIVWTFLLDYKDGPVNRLLAHLGLGMPLWLVGRTMDVIPTIVGIVCWQGMGFHMVVFLAALRGVPRELHEAAEIDGANGFRKFFRITLPMISPATFFLLTTSLLTSFHNFGTIYVFTKGGPGSSSRVLSINIYEEAFSYGKIAYATAQSLVLFAIILAITLVQWRGQKKWVVY